MQVRLALRYAGKPAPAWLNSLVLAEKWGVPPWVVAAQPGALRWAARQAVLDRERKYWHDFDNKAD